MFTCKKLRYYWSKEKNKFVKVQGLDVDVTTADLHRQCGLSPMEQQMRRITYGNNEIIVPVQSILALLFLEVLNPFYIFQLFSFCLWFIDNYIYYAVAILLMSAFGIILSVMQIRKVSSDKSILSDKSAVKLIKLFFCFRIRSNSEAL